MTYGQRGCEPHALGAPLARPGKRDAIIRIGPLRPECLQVVCKHSLLGLATNGFRPDWRRRPASRRKRGQDGGVQNRGDAYATSARCPGSTASRATSAARGMGDWRSQPPAALALGFTRQRSSAPARPGERVRGFAIAGPRRRARSRWPIRSRAKSGLSHVGASKVLVRGGAPERLHWPSCRNSRAVTANSLLHPWSSRPSQPSERHIVSSSARGC